MKNIINNVNISEFLRNNFKFNDFKPGQKKTIEYLLSGYSTLSILPTGYGKSLCYHFYGKYTNQRVLIVSPLISLIQDQVDQMKFYGETRVVALTSKLLSNEKKYIFHKLNKFQFIYVSPEMLKNKYLLSKLSKINIGLMVVDEAHCIVKWGPDFRPDYLLLGKLKDYLHIPKILALTATATIKTGNEIKKQLHFNANSKEIRYSVDRPNIFLSTEYLNGLTDKNKRLIQLVKSLKTPGLIYFSSKHKADEISHLLNSQTDLNVASYHSGLSLNDRSIIQRQFINDELNLICATSAFGMGINKNNIRYVIHYHMPGDIESYIQEIGRSGRDGKQSIAILLYSSGDEDIQKRIQLKSIPSNKTIKFYYKNKYLLSNIKNDEVHLLNDYVSMGFSYDQLCSFFNRRRSDKTSSLQIMLDYVYERRCKRNFILNYFEDSKFVLHNEYCCSYNGNYSLKNLNLLRNKDSFFNKKKLRENYLNVINKLFNLSNK